MKIHILAACAALGLPVAAPANAATLVIDGSGILTGATDVDVAGTLYNVSFVDGTCAAVFGGCDSASDFTFNTGPARVAAANALLDQVFLGVFDSNPALTRGCSDASICVTFIPSIVSGSSSSGAAAFNYASTGDSVGSYGAVSSFDLTSNPTYTWAKFNLAGMAPVAAVPEPTTWMLMMLGMAGIGFSMRRKDKQTLRVRFA